MTNVLITDINSINKYMNKKNSNRDYSIIYQKNRKCFIYCLFDKNETPVYVGKSVNPEHRFKEHKSYLLKQCKLLSPFTIEILEETTIKNSSFLEIYWIHQFLQWGFNLENNQHNFKKYLDNKIEQQRSSKALKIMEKEDKIKAEILGLTIKEYYNYLFRSYGITI